MKFRQTNNKTDFLKVILCSTLEITEFKKDKYHNH